MRISDWSSDVCSSDLISAELGDRTLVFSVGMAGAHWINDALAVIAAADALGGDLAAAGLALADLKGLAGRGEQRRVAVGDGDARMRRGAWWGRGFEVV